MTKNPFSGYRRECFAELLGTYLLVVFGPASVILTADSSFTKMESLVIVASVFALVVGMMIYILNEHSGAVINPAILISAVVSRAMKKDLFIPYFLSQIAGGLAAGLTLRILFARFDSTDLGSTKLSLGVTPADGIMIELLGTFVLASSALFAGRKCDKDVCTGVMVGATLFLLIIALGPLTGASFNPARSLGPALASGYINNLYIYLIGPCVGGLAAGILFRVNSHGAREKNTVRVRA